MTDLDDLDRLRAAASKLPWETELDKYAQDESIVADIFNESIDMLIHVDTGTPAESGDWAYARESQGAKDAAFIVAACNANEELVATVRRLTAANKRLRGLLQSALPWIELDPAAFALAKSIAAALKETP